MLSTKVINVLIVLSMLLTVVLFVWYLLGDSPTVEHMLFSAVFYGYVFIIGVYKNLNDKFENVNEKLNMVGERLARIEGKLDKQGGK